MSTDPDGGSEAPTDAERNEALLRRYIRRIYGEKDFSVIDEVIDEAAEFDWDQFPEVDTFEAFKSYMRDTIERFEEVDYEIHHVVADEEEGFARWTFSARLVEGFAGIPPTGRRRSVEVVTKAEFDGGIVGLSTLYDRRKLLPDVSRVARGGIIQHVSDGLLVVDRNDEIVDVNRPALSMLDADRLSIIGQPVSAHFGSETMLPPAGETVELTLADGRQVFEVSASAVTDTDGKRIGRVLVFHEITGRRRRSKQLAVLNRVLRHNLRNDLTTIIGQAEHLDATEDPDTERVDRAVERIVDTAEDLSELSEKVQRVADIFSPGRVNRRHQDIADVLAPVIARAGIAFPEVTLRTDVPESLPVLAIRSLEFALEAIVENACQHNDSPDPTVGVTAERVRTEEGVRVRITVADNGPGLPEYERRVLEAGEETPLEHSTGLDLWLVYWVVTLSGGELSFRENDPRGTVVTISLPTPDGGRGSEEASVEDATTG